MYDTNSSGDDSNTSRTISIAAVMARLRRAASRGMAGFLALFMILFYPAGAYATEQPVTTEQTAATPTSTTEPQPASTTAEPAPEPQPAPVTTPEPAPVPVTNSTAATPQPEAAPAKTPEPKPGYKYNESTGLWENGTYAWDPATGQTKPLTPPGYSYNTETGAWDTKDWRLDAASGEYVPNTVKLAPATSDGNSVKLSDSDSQFFDLYYDANISNNIYSSAQTGDASVIGNTLAGNALTGDALTIANIFNMLNSSIGLTGGGTIATFSSDIHGDVFGDLYIDPSALATAQQTSQNVSDNLEVNANLSNKIENNITLDAKSGDATVSNNTQAGSAASGSADAVANIVNMLNAAISSGSSFLGILNIYGNLNGDILLPVGLLNYLLASNGSGGHSDDTSLDVNLNDSQNIVNNVNASAASGTATVAHNTQAGSAVSGEGKTNVTILNLTGRNVVAANSLLVFVNVLGHWVGVIMDAPAGSTSAALGTGVQQNSVRESSDYDVTTNSEIKNNVNVTAASGDAAVIDNTVAGNATTGDASASVNIANIINSSFSLADWFGVLFINVFGTWNGSFGVDTAAGEKPAAPAKTDSKHGNIAGGKTRPKVFRFVPDGRGGTKLAGAGLSDGESAAVTAQAVEAASQRLDSMDDNQPHVNRQAPSNSPSGTPDLLLPAIGFALGGTLLGGERLISRRQRRE